MGRGLGRRRSRTALISSGPGERHGKRPRAKTDERVGERLRWARETIGLTQDEVAPPGYTRQLVARIEAGRVRPSPHTLEKLAERLGLTPRELAVGLAALTPRAAYCRAALLIAHAFASVPAGSREAAERDLTIAMLRSVLERLRTR